MNTEDFLRKKIRKLIILKEGEEEGEKTVGPGRGKWKASVKESEALAQKDPNTLMSRLKIGSVSGDTDLKKLFSLFKQATQNSEAMKTVYEAPLGRRNKVSGKEGIRIPVKLIPVRDGWKYITHTLLGAQNAGLISLQEGVQIEILSGSNDVLIYLSNAPRTWSKSQQKEI